MADDLTVAAPAAPASVAVVPAATAPAPAAPATVDGSLLPVAVPAAPALDIAPLAPVSGIDLYDDIKPDSIDQTGKRHFYSEPQSLKLQATRKMMREMTEIKPDLTVETFRDVVGRAQAAQSMMDMYRMSVAPGDQQAAYQSMDTLLNEVFLKDSPVAFGVLALRAAALVSQANPEAWQAMVGWHRRNLQGDPQMMDWHKAKLIEDAKDQIPLYQDLERRKQEAYFVQNLESRMGREITPLETLMRHVASAPATNPLAAERADLDRRAREIRESEQRAQNAQAAATKGRVNQAQEDAIIDEIAKFLTPLKDSGNADDMDFLQGRLRGEIHKAEISHEADWGPQYVSLFARATSTGSEQDIKSLTDYRRTIAQRVLLSNGKQITDAWAGRLVDRSNAARQNAANPQPNEPAPNGPGTPASPKGTEQLLKATNWKERFAAVGM